MGMLGRCGQWGLGMRYERNSVSKLGSINIKSKSIALNTFIIILTEPGDAL